MICTSIVGCGAISRVHADCLLGEKDVRIGAVCDTDPAQAEKLMREKGFKAPIFTDYEEMLDTLHPEAVHICTPHFLHARQAIAALRRGIHVFLEKPACMNEAELEEMREAERNSAAQLTVRFQNRFLRSTQTAKRIIDSGEAGKILGVRGFVTWCREGDYYLSSPWRGKKATEGGGVLMNQSIHTLDRMLYLCGDPDHADGRISSYHMLEHNDTEDTAEAYLTWKDGTKGIFFATTAFSRSCPVMVEVIGEKKTLRIEDSALYVNGEKTEDGEESSLLPGKSVWGRGHAKIIGAFYRNLGKINPVPLEEAARSLRVIWKIFQSAEKNQ